MFLEIAANGAPAVAVLFWRVVAPSIAFGRDPLGRE